MTQAGIALVAITVLLAQRRRAACSLAGRIATRHQQQQQQQTATRGAPLVVAAAQSQLPQNQYHQNQAFPSATSKPYAWTHETAHAQPHAHKCAQRHAECVIVSKSAK